MLRIGMKRWVSCVSGAAVLGSVLASCLGPTEIDLQVSTNVTPAEYTVGPQPAAILVGGPSTFMTTPSTSIQTGTADTKGSFGDLVIVPSAGSSNTVAIEVALGVNQATSTCVDPTVMDKSGCIIATRELQYVPHHELVLPIVLDSACLGISCPAGQTCVAGQCEGNTTDCDGGSCVTERDAAPPPQDAAIDTSDAACNGVLCGQKCVDLSSDPNNCGACGVDCSGGACMDGTCVLTTTGGSCLGIYGAKVYVIAANGALEALPTNGGSPVLLNILTTALDVHSIGTDMAVSGTTATILSTVAEYASSLSYDLTTNGGGRANRVTIDNGGVGWFDTGTGDVWYWKFNGTAAVSYYMGQVVSTASVAAANGIVYAALGATLCRTSAAAPTCLGATTSPMVNTPTVVTVSDPTSTTPTVYDVESGGSVFQFAYDLSTKTSLAKVPMATFGAIAWDSSLSLMYAISPTAVYKQSAATFATLASTANAASRCIAVDDTAVYWVTATGVYKHAK